MTTLNLLDSRHHNGLEILILSSPLGQITAKTAPFLIPKDLLIRNK